MNRDRVRHGLERFERSGIEKSLVIVPVFHDAQADRDQAPCILLREYDAGARVIKDVGDGIGGKLDVDRHWHDARAHRAEQRHDKLDTVEREDADAIARLEPQLHEPARDRVAASVELAETHRPRLVRVAQLDDRGTVGFRVLGEQQSEVAGIAARLWTWNRHISIDRTDVIQDQTPKSEWTGLTGFTGFNQNQNRVVSLVLVLILLIM